MIKHDDSGRLGAETLTYLVPFLLPATLHLLSVKLISWNSQMLLGFFDTFLPVPPPPPTCPKPSSPENGKVTCLPQPNNDGEYKVGTICDYSCDKGKFSLKEYSTCCLVTS